MKTTLLTVAALFTFCVTNAQTQKTKSDTASYHHNSNGTYHHKDGTTQTPDSAHIKKTYPKTGTGTGHSQHPTNGTTQPNHKMGTDTTRAKQPK